MGRWEDGKNRSIHNRRINRESSELKDIQRE